MIAGRKERSRGKNSRWVWSKRTSTQWSQWEVRYNQHNEKSGSESVRHLFLIIRGFVESVFSSERLRREVGPGVRPQERFEFENVELYRGIQGHGRF